MKLEECLHLKGAENPKLLITQLLDTVLLTYTTLHGLQGHDDQFLLIPEAVCGPLYSHSMQLRTLPALPCVPSPCICVPSPCSCALTL